MDDTPGAYPLALDTEAGRVNIVQLDEAAYCAASFLDERILNEFGPGSWLPWSQVERVAQGLAAESDFIFHIGHVGSTLLSRLLGDYDRIFGLREPAILRTLARMELRSGVESLGPYLGQVLRLYARVWRRGQRSLVKATSFVSELAIPMLDCSPSANAILMFVSPMTYVATLLAGPASRAALASDAEEKFERLHRRLGVGASALDSRSVDKFSAGELAALSWTCEICSLAAVAARFPSRVLWLDFDDFLQKPAAGLSAVLRQLHGEAPEATVEALIRSPHLGRYAKAPEYAYDAQFRQRILAQGYAEHHVEIERGIAWLNAAGTAHRLIAGAARLAAAAPRL